MQKMSQRSADKRNAILQAAKTVFLAEGFSNASVDKIVEVAAVSKKTVYHHFPDKLTLFNAVISLHWQTLTSKTETLELAEEKPIEKVLTEFAEALLSFLANKETCALFRILIAEANHFPNLARKLLTTGQPPFTQKLINYLDKQCKLNKLKIDDTTLAAYQFIGLFKEYLFWPKMLGFNNGDLNKNSKQVVKSAVAIFLKSYLSNAAAKSGKILNKSPTKP